MEVSSSIPIDLESRDKFTSLSIKLACKELDDMSSFEARQLRAMVENKSLSNDPRIGGSLKSLGFPSSNSTGVYANSPNWFVGESAPQVIILSDSSNDAKWG